MAALCVDSVATTGARSLTEGGIFSDLFPVDDANLNCYYSASFNEETNELTIALNQASVPFIEYAPTGLAELSPYEVIRQFSFTVGRLS